MGEEKLEKNFKDFLQQLLASCTLVSRPPTIYNHYVWVLYLQLLWADIFQHITDLEVDLHLLKQAQVGYFGSYYFS